MLKSRMMLSILIIALVAAVIGGGTMAWFTAKAEVANTFTAGTVMISAEETSVVPGTMDNVNPGDCYEKTLEIVNTGSKGIRVRMQLEEEWTFDWDWLYDNYEELCFTTLGEMTWAEFKEYVKGLESPTTITLEGWEEIGDYWYFVGDIVEPGGKEVDGGWFEAQINACFDGPSMGNVFQGATYVLNAKIEAVQASNFAPYYQWETVRFGEPTE